MSNTPTKDLELASEIAHKLSSMRPGDSECEQIAERIEARRAQRVPITFSTRVRFLHDCRRISRAKGYKTAKISKQDLQEYRDRIEAENNRLRYRSIPTYFGIRVDSHCLLDLLDHALESMESSWETQWFQYMDFNFFHSKVESRWPFMRTEIRIALFVTFLYYLCTPILFCNLMDQSSICQADGEQNYLGWVSSLYFASTTISTVGYGDLTVAQDPRWRSFVGSCYMIVSVVVAAVAFSAAAQTAVSPLEGLIHKICVKVLGEPRERDFLYQQIRRVRFLKLGEIALQFFTLNLLGVAAAQVAVALEDGSDPDKLWTWMTSFYWAIQTTTTIGYGDLAQPFGLRWFKIFYLILSTYSVGNCLGKLSALRTELSNVRRHHAWQRRKVTQRYIEETQAYDNDKQVDQYEFLVASLLTLGKISSEDITPVMDKFRELAGSKGFITMDDVEHDEVGSSKTEDAASNASIEDDPVDVEE